VLDLCPLCEQVGVTLKIGHHRSADFSLSIPFPKAPGSASESASSRSQKIGSSAYQWTCLESVQEVQSFSLIDPHREGAHSESDTTSLASEAPMFVHDTTMNKVIISDDVFDVLGEPHQVTTKSDNNIAIPQQKNRCVHGKIKYVCKDCVGSAICVHGRQRTACKNCKGSKLCSHGKEKRLCGDCTGASICQHNKEKKSCAECRAENLCSHRKNKFFCKDCKGKYLCEHGIRKYECSSCRGPSICPHGRRKARCVDCGGASMCQHGRRKW